MSKRPRYQIDRDRYDRDGIQPKWRSRNPLVPAGYRLDLEYVCFTNAENLSMVTGYTYVEGEARLRGDEGKDAWGDHAWCVTAEGVVVDPYFEWMFPGKVIEYRADPEFPAYVAEGTPSYQGGDDE